MSGEQDLERFTRDIMNHGPVRVVINNEGQAVNSARARNDHGIEADVIFIRNDGWSLAAPTKFESVAFNTWKDSWIGFLRKPSIQAQPINLYKPW